MVCPTTKQQDVAHSHDKHHITKHQLDACNIQVTKYRLETLLGNNNVIDTRLASVVDVPCRGVNNFLHGRCNLGYVSDEDEGSLNPASSIGDTEAPGRCVRARVASAAGDLMQDGRTARVFPITETSRTDRAKCSSHVNKETASRIESLLPNFSTVSEEGNAYFFGGGGIIFTSKDTNSVPGFNALPDHKENLNFNGAILKGIKVNYVDC